MLPDGLKYLDSWVEENLDRCFQLMETDDAKLFKQWIACWQDLVDFEVIPVVNSADAERKTGKGRWRRLANGSVLNSLRRCL